MLNLIFFDTETTGNTENDFLVQLAHKMEDESFAGLYKPPVKIPPEASAVHHISNKMIADKPIFAESDDFPKIKDLFENENTVVVAHNAPFDLMIIKKEGINPPRFICTLRLARYLDPEEKIERYNLQYLRYLLDLDVNAAAHDALGDVLVLEKLYERLKKKIMDENNMGDAEAIEKMIEISSHSSIIRTLHFGKHKGKKIEEVLAIDRGWLEWLLREKENGNQIDEDWVYTLKYYLGKD
jgi:exodeoxyribonuclease X